MKNNSIDTTNPLIQLVYTSTNAVVTCTTQIPDDNTIPQNTEGNQVISLSITPKYSTSQLLIEFTATLSASLNSATVALFQDSNANALSAISYRYGSITQPCVLRYIMTSGTTSSTTFNIRIGPSGAFTDYINANSSGVRTMGGTTIAFFSIKEYLD